MNFFSLSLLRVGLVLATHLALSIPGQAQTTPQAKQLRSDSFQAFQQGNATRALELLTASLDLARQTTNPSLQRLSVLTQFCFWFRNAGEHRRAMEVSEYALVAGRSAVSGATGREAARVHAILGGLFEHVRNDPAQARASYEAALKLQPDNASVRQRLGSLKAVENNAADKSRGDAVLRSRTKPTP